MNPSNDTPFKVAIVGAGPSGFYVADSLFKATIPLRVDCFDKLPTPFGLLRGGVAPDHQKMKSVSNYYHRVATKNQDHFRFFGNVTVGKDITLADLKARYHAIVFTYGAQSDRRLGIEGENLSGSHAATEFVGWYNGHPDYQHYAFDLSKARSVAVIGQGNVAIDVTRILAKSVQELSGSDITQNALDQLAKSTITDIHLIGRRGPVQAAFTELEIKELGELEDCNIKVNESDLMINSESQLELDDEKNNKARKNMAVLREFAQKTADPSKPKTIHLHFLKSPSAIIGSDHVTALELEHNALNGPAFNQKASGTGQKETIACDFVFRSVGYLGIAIPDVPFDEKRGVIPNEKGRVIINGSPVDGLYTSGWIKRGPSGVLGSNKPCAAETVACLMEDIPRLPDVAVLSDISELLESRNVSFVTYSEWERLDAEEIIRGQSLQKPREKFISIDEALAFLKG